jgi:hypothetical protein
MSTLWNDFLRSEAPAHAAEIYAELDELAESVADFLAEGFDAGEPGLIVARAEHLTAFMRALATRGWGAEEIAARAQLTTADAEETLAAVLDSGMPSAAAFERVVGALVDRSAASGARSVRVFGEMVDILNERGELSAAIVLEELWNGLQRTRSFSLLCAYRLDVFDGATQEHALQEVCRVHSHVFPSHDERRFRDAVDSALLQVLGPAKTRDVYYIVGGRKRERVPVAQDALRWVTANLPGEAEHVLARARALYA